MTYLQSTQDQIEEINSLLRIAGVPHRVSSRSDINGILLLGSDLLQDIDTNYRAAKEILELLEVVARNPEDFPSTPAEL